MASPSADWSDVPPDATTHPQALTSESSPARNRSQQGFAARLEGDAVLECVGELDLATNSVLRRSLNRVLRLVPDRVVLDLSRVSFFDAGAIGELVRARTTSRAAGGDLVVRAPSLLGRRMLSSVGLIDLIAVDPGQTAATIEASGDLGARCDELVAAWETACSTDRYGAAPLVFDPTTMISEILASVDAQTSLTPAAVPVTTAARRDETDAATAVMQLWALNDVLHVRSMANGAGSEQEERERLELQATLVALASATLAELEQTTLLDPLTGLLNRRALDRDLPESLAVARRHAQCLSVVMIDIEGLKATNDQLGHAAGDDTLRGVATSLASALRAGDNAYRIGGDEFVLVLPELCPDDVDGVMKRSVVGARGAFTWGCAWVKDDDDVASDAERATHLLEQADQRMFDYRARVRGDRERVDAPDLPARTLAEPTVELAGRFAESNRSSVVIDEAKGLIAEHFDTDIGEATIMLRAFADAAHLSMEAVAIALMDRAIPVARLADEAPSART